MSLGITTVLSGQSESDSVSVSFYVYLWPSYSGFAGKSHANFEEYSAAEELGSGRILKANKYKLPLLYASGVDEDGVLEDPEQVELRLGRLSALQSYSGPGTLYFYLPKNMGDGVDGAPQSIGSVTLDPAVKKFIILLIRTGESSYRLLPVPYPEVDGADKVNFAYNLTSDSIGCTMGVDHYQLEPMQSVVLDSKIVDTYFEMILVAARDSEGKWERKLSRKYPREDAEDTLFLVFNRDGNREHFDLMRIKIGR
ncbi:hypothetical protein [Puniceicoccus vermicola]|uniref:Uncharacterized protein n=1 Tax=Puniceicoccus vermicola TaxID=388746 RepID=A0A7X1E4Z9_9BACT|nr:hypothetical protein [Puniceicoccus vermicola]MBC2602599.1 hypothetical protein [Puniceicoccus vermicola]